jgi:putative flavoprotein involved in K+ transport
MAKTATKKKAAPRKKAKAIASKSPTQMVTAWLKRFDTALVAGDVDAVVKLFGADSYWRDLVSFTWNIKTLEGHDQIAGMLKATLKKVKPSNWKIEGEATEGGGLQEA